MALTVRLFLLRWPQFTNHNSNWLMRGSNLLRHLNAIRTKIDVYLLVIDHQCIGEFLYTPRPNIIYHIQTKNSTINANIKKCTCNVTSGLNNFYKPILIRYDWFWLFYYYYSIFYWSKLKLFLLKLSFTTNCWIALIYWIDWKIFNSTQRLCWFVP